MKSDSVIGFDVDGVLANFTRGFTKIAYTLFGTAVGDHSSQREWMFEDFPECELNAAQCALDGPIWSVVKADPLFWETLDPLNTSVMARINAIPQKVFITNRMGIDAKGQTERFLMRWGIDKPVVVLASKKSPVVAEYGVDAYIDDYYKNCVEIYSSDFTPAGHYTALLATGYNQKYWFDFGKRFAGDVVLSVEHFLNTCEDVLGL